MRASIPPGSEQVLGRLLSWGVGAANDAMGAPGRLSLFTGPVGTSGPAHADAASATGSLQHMELCGIAAYVSRQETTIV